MLARPLSARYADYVPVFPERQHTSAQRAGLKFEKDVIRRLQLLHTRVVPGPWLYYKAGRSSGVCQPDALVWLDEKLLCVVECKLSWVRGARLKLLTFYGPILQAIHPDVELCYLQVYKNARKGCHKRKLTLYELDKLKKGQYKECQALL